MKAMLAAANVDTDASIDSAKTGMRIRSTGRSGAGTLSWYQTKPAPMTPAPASSSSGIARLGALLIPSMPVIRRPKVRAFSAALSQSKRRALFGVSGSARAAIARATAPLGTLTGEDQGQGAR